jgi:site-specific DNA recombinase
MASKTFTNRPATARWFEHNGDLLLMTLPRAVIYARYSTENQREASIEDQIRVCKDRVAHEGWEVIKTYRDSALSGASAHRPAYQALLEGARNGAFDILVAEALDRLSRDQEDIAGLYKRMRYPYRDPGRGRDR